MSVMMFAYPESHTGTHVDSAAAEGSSSGPRKRKRQDQPNASAQPSSTNPVAPGTSATNDHNPHSEQPFAVAKNSGPVFPRGKFLH